MSKSSIDILENRDGYLIVEDIRPGRGGRIFQHRLVMELHINRLLEANEEVHHVNLKRDSNQINNLVLLERDVHRVLHEMLDAGRRADVERTLVGARIRMLEEVQSRPRIRPPLPYRDLLKDAAWLKPLKPVVYRDGIVIKD